MQEYLILLRQILTERFDAEELRTLCFDLGIDYDDLPGRGRAAKARELVAHIDRRERIPDCIQAGRQARPDILWEQVQLAWLEAAQREAPDPRRFQPLIEELQATIAHWEGRVERQRERIAEGLEAQRRRMTEEQARRHEKGRLRVVGQPPLDVADYFKNRRREQETIGQLLLESTTRLISVVGHGGMGKTALACKVLQDLERHRWPHTDEDMPIDGIVYLSTRTAGISLERLFLDCAKLLGGKQQERLNAVWTNPQLETQEKIARLLETLSEGRYVILLDNLEDLLDDRSQLTDDDLRLFFDRALTTAWGAQLVVTSRVALAFRREVMRFDRQVKLLEGLPVEDGMALLRELDPNGDYGLRDAPEEQLAEAMELAHGVPRALEVLAGILANDPFASLEEVLETFYKQEDVVQALIEENYRRLDRDARRVIEALAVFRRPVPPLAVDYLLEPFAPGLDVPGILRRLARTNIVSVDRAAKTVTLHPIDQDYAYRQLPEEESAQSEYTRQSLERRAAEYYVQLRTSEETWESIEDLEPQLNEFEHRIRAGEYDGACQILDTIDDNYLYQWGYYPRLAQLRTRLLEQLTDPESQVNNLYRLGVVCRPLKGNQQASELFRQGLDLARRYKKRKQEGRLLGQLGRIQNTMGHLQQALGLIEYALDIAREVNDLAGECDRLISLAVVHRRMKQIGESVKLYRQALSIAQRIKSRRKEGVILSNLGFICMVLGQMNRAIKYYEEALTIAREIGHRGGEGTRLANLGVVYYKLGRPNEAMKLYQEALDIARESDSRIAEAIRLGRLGQVHQALRHFEQAIHLYREALTIDREMHYPRGESFRLLRLGQSHLAAGNLLKAKERCLDALNLNIESTRYQAKLTLGIVLVYQHNTSAGEVFKEAVDLCQARTDKTADSYQPHYTLATALVGQAVCDPRWADENQRPELLAPALAEYRRALAITAAPGVVQDALRDLELIQAAGIEGLEPVFELLESAEYEPDEVPLDDILPET